MNRNYSPGIIYVLFFFSGAAGLAYEVLWTRILSLSFGHTTYAVTTVLVAFMGGLALGSYFFGRIADRLRNPLRFYAGLELAIGAYCLAAPTLLTLTRKAYLSFYPSLAAYPFARTLIQFFLAFLVLIVPTTLMGGTLPVVTRAIVTRLDQTGNKVGLLYGTNTIGAAVGAFAAGYWLLPTIGNSATNHLGAAINIIVGLLAIILFRNTAELSEDKTIAKTQPVEWGNLEKILLWAFALSGAVAMSYQIVWVRTLVLVLGSSTYAFSSILVTFLLGIALGSFIFTRIKGGETPSFFAGLQLGTGLAAAFLIPFFALLPRIFLSLFKSYTGNYNYIQFIQFLMVAMVVLIPTTLMGMTFPCISGILTRNINSVGKDIGKFYAFNTFGAILGSMSTGFFLMSFLGIQRTLVLCISLNLLLAVFIAVKTQPEKRYRFYTATALMIGIIMIMPQWNKRVMVSGASIYPMNFYNTDETSEIKPRHKEWELLFFKEGISSTVAVTRSAKGNRTMRVNGLAEAGTQISDLESFIKLAYLPMIIHPDPRNIAIVGLGGGITAYTATRFDTVDHIDIIELDPAVVEAQRIFSPGKLNALTDERTSLTVDDGRSFIEGSRNLYDIIICAPSQTWVAGVANLFTLEFLSAARNKLATGGILCLWIQGYNLENEVLRTVMRTFHQIFPETSLWEGYKMDYFLIGSKDGWETLNLDTLSSRLNKNNQLLDFLKSQGEKPIENLLASFRLNADGLSSYSGEGPLNTDDLNQLEFSAPKTLYSPFPENLAPEIQSYRSSNYPSFIRDQRLDSDQSHLRLGSYLMRRDKFNQALWEFQKVPPSRFSQRGSGMKQETLDGLGMGQTVMEEFGEDIVLPYHPLVNGYRPANMTPNEEIFTTSQYEYFTRTSGAKDGHGRNGSVALTINSISDFMPVSFVMPLQVEPDTQYEVEFWIRSDAGKAAEFGAAYMEFDSYLLFDRAFSLQTSEKHLLRGEKAVAVRGSFPWTRKSFTVTTSPQTRMVHIQFYRYGEHDEGTVYFDDVTITKVPRQAGSNSIDSGGRAQ